MEGLLSKLKENWYKFYFMLAIGIASFAYGVIICTFKLFPYQTWLHNK